MEYLLTTEDVELLVESQRRNICEEIVDRLYSKRIQLNMTQQDIANITGIKRSNIARFEACTTTPTIDVLIKYATAVGCKLDFVLEEDETQRNGRNKETIIDNTYISSGEYRKKFDLITNSPDMNRLLYQKAKEMLQHRSGTEFEDMYWFDMDAKSVICSKLDETNSKEIRHTKAIDKKLKECNSILAMHTHPHSMPPSAEDFNSFVRCGYQEGIALCHDGTIYRYKANGQISERLVELYVNRYYKLTHEEKLAQLEALNEFLKRGEIFFEEVCL